MKSISMDVFWRQTDPYIPEPVKGQGGLALLRARLLILFCWLFVLTAVFALIPALMRPETALYEIVFFGSFAVFAGTGPIVLRRTGKTALIGVTVAAVGVAAAISGALWMEGIFSASIVWVAVLPLLSAFLLGADTTGVAIVIASLVFTGVAAVHGLGYNEQVPTPLLVHRVVNLIALTVFCSIIARLHEWSAAQAQASEREAFGLLQVVSSRVGVGTILIEANTIRLANAAAEHMLGRAPGSLNGKPWSTALPDHAGIDLADPTTLRDFDVPDVTGITDASESCGTRRLTIRTDAVPGLRGPAVLVTLMDITERWQAEQQQQIAQAAIARSLHEKETLIKEIHHRVKNNLQIVSSLLELQSAQLPNESSRELLQESIHRVRSMALIHQHLYGMESLARIDFGSYALSLADSLRVALSPATRVRVDAGTAPIELSIELAVPVGLILNELITNAIKYGKRIDHPDGARISDDCDVQIDLHFEDQQLVLGVANAGPGLPEGFDATSANTLGLQLIHSLTRQIRGRVRSDSKGGARFELRCAIPT